jgi:hypothetical protein
VSAFVWKGLTYPPIHLHKHNTPPLHKHTQEALVLVAYHDPLPPRTTSTTNINPHHHHHQQQQQATTSPAALTSQLFLHLASRPWLGKNLILVLAPSSDEEGGGGGRAWGRTPGLQVGEWWIEGVGMCMCVCVYLYRYKQNNKETTPKPLPFLRNTTTNTHLE